MPLSQFFIQSLNAVYDELNQLLYADFVTMKTTNNLEQLRPLVDTISQLQAEVMSHGLRIKALNQAHFHATNLMTMTHLTSSIQWQYAKATLAELSLVKRFIDPETDHTDITDEQIFSESPLTALPPELISHIASFLPYQDLKNLKKTNRFFNTFSSIDKHLKKTLKAILATDYETYYLLSDGQAFVKGGPQYPHFTKIQLHNDLPIKTIITDHIKVFFIDRDNGIHVAGINTYGSLGMTKDPVIKRHTPVPFSWDREHSIKTIITKGYQTFIQDETGLWFGYGNNKLNVLGIKDNKPFTETGMPLFSDNIDKIVPGFSQTFFLINGQWYVSGHGSYGELGRHPDALPAESPFPFILPHKEAIVDIKAGHHSTFVKGISGQWYACGNNQNGTLGIKIVDPRYPHRNTKITTPTPINLPNDKKLIDIVCYFSHTYMQDEDGNWYGCGRNANNELALTDACSRVDVPTPMCFTTSANPIKTIHFGYKTHYFLDTHDQWWQFGGKAKTPKPFNMNTLVFDDEQALQSSSSSSSNRL